MKSILYVSGKHNLIEQLMERPSPTVEIPFSCYSGGEVKLDLPEIDFIPTVICAYLTCSDGIMALVNLIEHVRSISDQPLTLIMPYVPYARQDRKIGNDHNALKVFARLINSLEFKQVIVYDAHSIATEALLDNCVVIDSALPVIERAEATYVSLVAPDLGAVKRTDRLAKIHNFPTVYAHKQRDHDGNIIRSELLTTPENINNIHSVAIITDDICDGGRTFIELAPVLRSAGFDDVILSVTHGIFSRGTKLNGIDHVIAQFDWTDEESLRKELIRICGSHHK